MDPVEKRLIIWLVLAPNLTAWFIAIYNLIRVYKNVVVLPKAEGSNFWHVALSQAMLSLAWDRLHSDILH
jgi:hypothetical protein